MSSATEQYLESMIASSEAVDVPTMVDYLIQDSLARGASDIHIEPWEDMVGVRVRVNGVLQWLVGIPQRISHKRGKKTLSWLSKNGLYV